MGTFHTVGYQKLQIASNSFSDIVQTDIFATERTGWTKINEILLNRRLITSIIRLQNMLWKTVLEWLSHCKLNEDR